MREKVFLWICVAIVISLLCDEAYSCCEAPIAEIVVDPDEPVCVGEEVTFEASESHDPDGTSLTYEWDFDGDEETDETGEIVTYSFDSSGEKTVKLTVTDNDDPDCCGGQPNCSDKKDSTSWTVTVVGVEITDDPEWVLAYINEYAGTQPTKTATAQGAPTGGTYSWTWSSGGGSIVFVDGQTSSTTTITGLWYGSVTLEVAYTLDGKTCHDSTTIKVRRVSSTSCTGGVIYPSVPDRTNRKYYHKLYDQDDDLIDVAGVPCKEYVYEDDVLVEQTSAPTGNKPDEDGDWKGGICLFDMLSYPNSVGSNTRDQFIKAGGWATSPRYYLYFDLGEEEKIRKVGYDPE